MLFNIFYNKTQGFLIPVNFIVRKAKATKYLCSSHRTTQIFEFK